MRTMHTRETESGQNRLPFIPYCSPGGRGRQGAVLLIVLMVLALTTLMGVYSATKSSVEMRSANALRWHVSLFYIAEAGLDHATKILMNDFNEGNAANINAGTASDWDFALDGSFYGTATALSYYCEGCLAGGANELIEGAWVDDGVSDFISREVKVGNLTINYMVSFWDNIDYGNDADSGNDDTVADDDTDGLIIVRSLAEARAPDGTFIGRAMHEATLSATLSQAMGVVGGTGQAGMGAGKAGESGDTGAISAADLGNSTNL